MRPASLVRKLAAFRRHTRANTIMMFAFALLPIMIAMGASIDFVRAYNARTKMQADLDVALLAAVKKISNDDASQLKALIQTWFSTQTSLDSYSLASISVDTSNATITAFGEIWSVFA